MNDEIIAICANCNEHLYYTEDECCPFCGHEVAFYNEQTEPEDK